MIEQRDLCCPGLEPGETIVLVIRPETPSGKKRPRRLEGDCHLGDARANGEKYLNEHYYMVVIGV